MLRVKRSVEILLLISFFSLMSAVVLKNNIPSFSEPGRDAGFFMYAGRQLLQGKQLYVDVWDSKGPVIFYLNALGLFLGRNTRWGVWGLEIFFMTVSALTGFTVMKRRWGILPALFGGIIGLLGAKQIIGTGNFTEEYSLLFTWISIFAFYQAISNPDKKLYPFVMSAMLALNFLLRANNIGTQAVLLLVWSIYLFIKNKWTVALKKWLLAISGAFVVFILVAVYFASIGTLDDMFTASILYNFSYSFDTRMNNGILNNLGIALQEAFPFLRYEMALAVIGIVILAIKVIRQIRTKQIEIFDIAILCIWPVEILASSISGRGYAHYFICWLPAISLLSGLVFYDFSNRVLRADFIEKVSKQKTFIVYGLGILLACFIYNNEIGVFTTALNKILFHRAEGIEYVSPTARYIRNNTAEDETVLVWGGQAGINLMGHRDSSTAYIYYPLYSKSSLGIEFQKKFYDQLVTNKPDVIVDGYPYAPDEIPSLDRSYRSEQNILYYYADNSQQVFDFIDKNYEIIREIDGLKIYRLKSAPVTP